MDTKQICREIFWAFPQDARYPDFVNDDIFVCLLFKQQYRLEVLNVEPNYNYHKIKLILCQPRLTGYGVSWEQVDTHYCPNIEFMMQVLMDWEKRYGH